MRLASRWVNAACVAPVIFAATTGGAHAGVKVGVTLSATGPAASLGIPGKNTIALLPQEIAGQKVEDIVLDDATDSTQAGRPGTKTFRDALRVALENRHEVAGAHGIFNMSVTDHAGLDQRARVMVEIVGGKWKLAGD